MRPKFRAMPRITQLTSVLDTEITCTLCQGAKLAYFQGAGISYCPTCKGTGKMKSRTREEQEALNVKK